jgi:hypothetical protein
MSAVSAFEDGGIAPNRVGVALLHEINLGYSGISSHCHVVLICQINFEGTWRAEYGGNDLARSPFVLGADAYDGAELHLKYVLVHVDPFFHLDEDSSIGAAARLQLPERNKLFD